jgi:hypothetical protein
MDKRVFAHDRAAVDAELSASKNSGPGRLYPLPDTASPPTPSSACAVLLRAVP